MGKTGEKTTLSKLHYDHIQGILDDESQLPILNEKIKDLKSEQASSSDIIRVKDIILEIKYSRITDTSGRYV